MEKNNEFLKEAPEGYIPDERDTIADMAKSWRDVDRENRSIIVLLLDATNGSLTGLTASGKLKHCAAMLERACDDNQVFEGALAAASFKLYTDRLRAEAMAEEGAER